MPNWCDLDVSITGSKEKLEEILAKGSEGTFPNGTDWNPETNEYRRLEYLPNVFSFENFYPTPKHLLEGEGWYDWRIENWGTKWDLGQLGETSLTELSETDGGEYYFRLGGSTAWGPATALFRKISEDYGVKVVYQYAEESMGFFGRTIIENGVIVLDDYRDITSEDYKKAGAVLDADGDVDWDNTDEYDLYKVL